MLTGVPPPSSPREVPPKKDRQTYLSFDLLEDVMSLPPSRYKKIVEQATVVRIGPLVEYAFHHHDDIAKHLTLRDGNQAVSSFARALQSSNLSRMADDTSMKARPVEFFRVPQSFEEVEDRNWVAFCKRLEDAGVKAGLSKQFSQGLAGTFGEMMGNLLEHSERPESGVVGYRWRVGEFEYLVADAGIGVLQSLRQHPDYAWLSDSGEALETAVCDGESRFGRKQFRGTGFHNLIFNIANRNSYLRFRSGDHCYVLDGTQSSPRKKTQHCAPFQGFLTSVVSKPLNKDRFRVLDTTPHL